MIPETELPSGISIGVRRKYGRSKNLDDTNIWNNKNPDDENQYATKIPKKNQVDTKIRRPPPIIKNIICEHLRPYLISRIIFVSIYNSTLFPVSYPVDMQIIIFRIFILY